MIFRKAKEADLQAISDIYSAQESGKVYIGWIRDVYPTYETAESSLRRGDLFVQQDEDLIVGAAIINHQQVDVYKNIKWKYEASDHEVMVLNTLVISPKVSRKGYGRSFVKFYEEYALSHNCHYLRIDTNAKNSNARAMYKKLGYSEMGTVPCVFNGIDGVNLVMLEKRLYDEDNKN